MSSSISFINTRETDLVNLRRLSKRHRGDIFYVKNNTLQKMNLIQKIFLFISKYFFINAYSKTQNEVKNVITDITNRISATDKDFLIELFYKRLAPISEDAYDRSKVNKNILKILKKDVDSSFEILKAKEKIKFDSNQIPILPFSKNRKEYFTRYNNSVKFKNVLSDAKLALLLGVRPIKPQGYSKTYILKDLNHKNIAVFKPKIGDSLSTEAPFFLTRWQNKFLNFIGFGGSIYTFVAGNCHIAEKASYVIDQKINTNIVPPTDIVNLDPRIYKRKKAINQRGSFQLFAQNAIAAKDFLRVYKNYNRVFDFLNVKPRTKLYLDKLPSHLFDKLVINDVLEGNMDRHSENWLIILDDKDKKKAKNIVLIDGGMSFSPKHANTSFERSKQYFWAKESFPWVNRRFSAIAKKAIQEIFNQKEKLQEELFYTYVSEGDKEKIAKKRAQAMGERIQMLHYFANIKDLPIYKLREYRTEKEISNAIKKLNDAKK